MAQQISPARAWAVNALETIFEQGKGMDAVLADQSVFAAMSPRDRALARAIAGTALRHNGQIDAVLAEFLDRPLPKKTGRIHAIMRAASAEILFMRSPAFAVVSEAVNLAARERESRPFKALANAVLRKIASQGAARLSDIPQTRNLPSWLRQSWQASYGKACVRQAAKVLGEAPPTDLTIFGAVEKWAHALGGDVLGPHNLRLGAQSRLSGRPANWPGYAEGAWQVQDAAASLPAIILAAEAGEMIADLCAAPGGKTAQLACTGAKVWALERDPARVPRLEQNLQRLGLDTTVLCADALSWKPAAKLDAVLLDAPCTATGIFRRQPDVLVRKTPAQVKTMAKRQFALLRSACALLKPGGRLVYCVCSAQMEEGEQIAALALDDLPLQEQAIKPASLPFGGEFVCGNTLRIAPGSWASRGGLDAFFMAAFRRI